MFGPVSRGNVDWREITNLWDEPTQKSFFLDFQYLDFNSH